jgi:hypothetical protein
MLKSAQATNGNWRLSMLLAIVVATGCSDRHNTMPIPQMEKETHANLSSEVPEIVVVGGRTERHGDHAYHISELVLLNPLATPVYYYGYRMDSWVTRPPAGEISPFYARQIKTADDPAWHEEITGWCGTGAGMMVVPPNHAGRFTAMVRMPVLSARVGIVCSWEDANGNQHEEEIWSKDFIGASGHSQKF